MSYYKEHSQEFINETINCDMSELYRFFEKYLKKGGTVLDIGFGSGRDSLYFKSKGYDVYSIDPEESFVEHAKQIGLTNVYQQKAEDIDFANKFDGIWACASLLHVDKNSLNSTFKKCATALKNGSFMYVSFKYGDYIGQRNGRYYIDLNEQILIRYLVDTGLKLIESVITNDVRLDRQDKWLNIILKKEKYE